MKFLFVIPLLFVISWAAETRFKVGFKRWAFNINTSDGKHQREEFVDEDGVAHGRFSFSSSDGEASNKREVKYKYKFDSSKEPDFVFNTNTENEEIPMFNYSSIDNNDKEFAGHVIFKIGSSMYEFNFMTGDKKQTREEMLSKDGLLFGKITYLDEKEQLKVVRYRFNVTGENPEFEVSMDNRSTEKLQKAYKQSQTYGPNQYSPYDNRLTRRVLPPQYRAEMRGPPPRQVRPAGPNVVAPTSGNWYYTVQ